MRGYPAAELLRSALAALFSLCLLAGLAMAEVVFEKTSLTIEGTQGKKAVFTVELAITDEQRMQGLMHRESMPEDHGMLFDFGETRPVMMWMKNTILPLDMLFLDELGVVRHIKQGAVPFSESLIFSGGPVRYVLELNAGRVKHLGLAIGDRADTDIVVKRK